VSRTVDVLLRGGEVDPCELARPVAPLVSIGPVDRRHDGAAGVDVGSDVLARVKDEGGSRDRRRQAAVRDLARERVHLRRGGSDVHGWYVPGWQRFLLQAGNVGAPRVAFVRDALARTAA